MLVDVSNNFLDVLKYIYYFTKNCPLNVNLLKLSHKNENVNVF